MRLTKQDIDDAVQPANGCDCRLCNQLRTIARHNRMPTRINLNSKTISAQRGWSWTRYNQSQTERNKN